MGTSLDEIGRRCVGHRPEQARDHLHQMVNLKEGAARSASSKDVEACLGASSLWMN